MNLRLHARLALSLVPMIALALMLLASLFYLEMQRRLQHEASSQLDDVLQHTSANFDRALQVVSTHIRLMAESSAVTDYFRLPEAEGSHKALAPVMQLFATYQQTLTAFADIQLLDAQGSEQARLTQDGWPRVPLTPAQREQVLSTAGTAVIPWLDNPQWGLLLVHALGSTRPGDGTLAAEIPGYLVVTLRPDSLQEILDAVRIGTGGYLMLQNRLGQTLMRPSAPVPSATLSHDPRHAGKGQVSEPLQATHIRQSRTWLPDVELVGVWPQDEITQTNRQVIWKVLGFMLAALAVITCLIMLITHRLVIRPVQELQAMTRKLGEGDLDYFGREGGLFLETGSRKDEIGVLARTLNEMSVRMQASNMRLKLIAYHDNLTGLYNRHMFYKQLRGALKRVADANTLAIVRNQPHEKLVVLFLDMDGFKEVNDTQGHEIGDQVLKAIARRVQEVSSTRFLKETLGNRKLNLAVNLYRTGGDEFALIIEGERCEDAGLCCANEVVTTLLKPFEAGEHSYHLGSSLGIAVFPDDAENIGTLLKRVELAMFNAKQQGGNVALRYKPNMESAAIENHRMESDLRKALEDNQFRLFYQPQFAIRSGDLIGCEALMRWEHPERGSVSPAYFIPYAEQNGLIVAMGEWALNEACRQNKAWQDAGLKKIRVAVNVSTEQFNRMTDIVGMIRETLERTGLSAEYLDLEITESGIMQSGDVAIDTLNAIKALGAHLSMDDFGTGYSSLASLRDLPIDKLKIDRSFVNGIHHGERGQTLIQAIIALSSRLGVKVVAEGVEDRTQLDFLDRENCEYVQGYLTGRPLPAQDMEALLRKLTSAP